MMMRNVIVGALWVFAWGARAQDTRVVNEPKVPPVCQRLEAKLESYPDANGGHLREQDEGALDTERIQKALDGCKPGMAVELSTGWSCKGPVCGRNISYEGFLTGPLELREGVTLLVDKGVTLYGSRDPNVYEIHPPIEDATSPLTGLMPAKCGTSMPRPAARRGGCRPLISINGVKNAAVMGEGSIDGRGYAKILGKDYSWWEQARRSEPKDDVYFNPRLVQANHADGLVLYGVHLNNSPNFHVAVNNTNGFTAWGVHLDTPVDKRMDARNTDGIDPGTSKNITVAYSWIDNGDDNIAVKQGVSHMSVLHNHFYDGHGMSIGSETLLGQSFLLVDDLTEDHTTSGIRIKSNVIRGGPVHDLVYKNICMKDVPIPIAISPYYTNQTVEPFDDPKYTGDKIPDYKRITLEDIFSETPGDVLIAGLNDAHRTQVSVDAVHIERIKPEQVHLKFVDFVDIDAPSCTAFPMSPPTNWLKGPSDGTVRLLALPRAGCGAMPLNPPDPCAGKFVPYQ